MNLAINRTAGILTTACLAAGLCIAIARAANAPGTNLYINGGLASSRIIQHDGMAYVPVSDVAKALNQIVVAKADGYSITPAGGANQVSGLNGKIGDKLTDGDLQITVVKALRTDSYTTQFNGKQTNVIPDHPGDDLTVAIFRVKNMKKSPVELALAHGENTALTDQDEHSYQSDYTDSHDTVPRMIAGSACKFALFFSVPKSEKVGDLIYQVYSYGATKPSIFRISLASINP